MKKNELRDLFLTGATFFNCENVESFSKLALDRLVSMLDTSGILFILTNSNNHDININRITSWNISEKYVSSFRNYYYRLCPFSFEILSTGSVVLTSDQIIPTRKLTKSKYYLEFLKPQAFYYHLAIVLRRSHKILGVVILFRKENTQNFTLQEKEKIQMITPYLTSALDYHLGKEKLMMWRDVYEATLRKLPQKGYIVLDENIEMLYYNSFARQVVLKEFKGFKGSVNLQLPESLTTQCKSMFAENKNNEDTVNIKYNPICTEGVSELAIELKMLKQSNGRFYILMEITEEGSVLSLSQQLRKYGISNRELDVVFLIYQGLKNTEISEKLFISEHTVENHLRSIYQKMDVNNRTSLVHKLILMGEVTYKLIPIQDFPSL